MQHHLSGALSIIISMMMLIRDEDALYHVENYHVIIARSQYGYIMPTWLPVPRELLKSSAAFPASDVGNISVLVS